MPPTVNGAIERAGEEARPYAGVKLTYVDPTTGGSAMPTISTFLQLVPKGFRTRPLRSTENTVFSPVEGRGRLIVGETGAERTIAWKPRDILTVPCWVPYAIEADDEATIFSFSDRIAQEKLGLWREQAQHLAGATGDMARQPWRVRWSAEQGEIDDEFVAWMSRGVLIPEASS